MLKKTILIFSSFLLISTFLGWHFDFSNKTIEDSLLKKSGIIFFTTKDLDQLDEFYLNQIGCKLWLDQGTCKIYKFGNMLLGFCKGNKTTTAGTITFFFEKRDDVDLMYKRFKTNSKSPPKENNRYKIYHFYAQDPEGRSIEFQHFLHPINWNFDLYKAKK